MKLSPYKECKRLRRQHARKIVSTVTTIQTFRIVAKLECGHFTYFTLSQRAYRENNMAWKERRYGCWECYPLPKVIDAGIPQEPKEDEPA